jgi:transcriptional regulator with XRE-family HTH domain
MYVFHEALTLARLELGLTQQEAGVRIGLSSDSARRTFSYYERGVREPGPERVQALRQMIAEAVEKAKTVHPAPRGADEDAVAPAVSG